MADSGDRAARLEALTGALVHRFNNVLMGIQPHVEVIKRTGKENERILGSATQIEAALRRARAVMSEIMRLVRPPVINAQPIAVDKWFEMLRDDLQTFATNPITLTFDPGKALVVSGDRDQLSRVIASLVTNAVEAMPNGGKVSVSARAVGSGVELEVADTGSGMDPEMLAHVFDPLFTTKRNSAGLGLSIAQQIVEAHGRRPFVDRERARNGDESHIRHPGRVHSGTRPEPRRARGIPRDHATVPDPSPSSRLRMTAEASATDRTSRAPVRTRAANSAASAPSGLRPGSRSASTECFCAAAS